MTPEVQKQRYKGPHKRDLCPRIIFLNKTEKRLNHPAFMLPASVKLWADQKSY